VTFFAQQNAAEPLINPRADAIAVLRTAIS
jgi:hypothetical protein